MIIRTKNNQTIILRQLDYNDLDKLTTYLSQLSDETKRRFGPHSFDRQSVFDFYKKSENAGYIALNTESGEYVAYFVIQMGYLEKDSTRLQSYQLKLDNKTDATFAPSVADSWQSFGVGNALFNYVLTDLKQKEIKRIILWGGVQGSNEKARNYYKKNGFLEIGSFSDHHGENFDMILNDI